MVVKGCAHEDGGVSLVRRFQLNGTNAIKSDVDTITWKAWNIDDATTVTASGTLTVSDVVFDGLQKDGFWTIDGTGYNFRHDIAASVLATGGATYRIEHKITPVSGEVTFLKWEVTTNETWTS